jgi:hypothetical protein
VKRTEAPVKKDGSSEEATVEIVHYRLAGHFQNPAFRGESQMTEIAGIPPSTLPHLREGINFFLIW